MAKYSEKENQKPIGASPQPTIVAEKEAGIAPEEKKLLKESMRRHDKALRMLADM